MKEWKLGSMYNKIIIKRGNINKIKTLSRQYPLISKWGDRSHPPHVDLKDKLQQNDLNTYVYKQLSQPWTILSNDVYNICYKGLIALHLCLKFCQSLLQLSHPQRQVMVGI